ncbi:type IV secretory system conjugative DNA transfer family protein [Tautonia rosea]|uniref:type IV secretory system conjugative DNA transfer family protein n=1 Tax=Tautonia rosea TaxID=2728037 RepID=UPI00147633DB|nr:TraM recognition domain-containing protein [Tautonia rosea]
MWRRRSPTPVARRPWDLSETLLDLSESDPWTIGDACEGTLVLGATGSGKSSGSGRALALAFLRAGFGGLVLTAKPDERAVWESYCREAGREGDLLAFGPGRPLRFNFIDHELRRRGVGAGLTENIVNLLSTVLEVAERGGGGGGGREDEGYWRRAMRQLMRNLVDLLVLSGGGLSIPDLYRLVVSAPTSPGQAVSPEWKRESFCYSCLKRADERDKTPGQRSDYEIVADYLMLEYPALSEKTRSVIVSTFTSMIDVLNRGILRELFCGETNVGPEVVESGKVLVIDLPVKEFAEVGAFAQVLWKYVFQRSIERRDAASSPRPAFFWADEAQNFVTSYDMQFQTTARSSRVATVLLSQNLPNFYAALGGGERGKAEADSLLANLNTKIFHANGDPATNEWASSLVGRTRQFFLNGGNSYQAGDPFGFPRLRPPPTVSAGMSESYEFDLQPSVFTSLRRGGYAHGGEVDGIVFQGGRRFRWNGRSWLRRTFRQGP